MTVLETEEPFRRRVSRRALLRAAAGIGLAIPAAGLLAACGGGSDDRSGSTAEPTDTPSRRVPVRGGTLKVALTGDPPNLDLMQTTDSIVMLVTSHIYETLFTWDADYRPVPLLAASHEVSEDGLLNTITLREDVTVP